MISIIICSINKVLFEQVSKSIADTIFVEYEVIRIDNTITNFGICKAYNLGAAQAKYNYLCFLHEDILIKSNNWGAEIIEFFEQHENVGVVGVAGAVYKSLVPSVWAQGLYNTDHVNIIQHYKKTTSMNSESVGDHFSEVKTLDGVFLFTTKKVWQAYHFDEKTFDKFHCYDLDFCLQIGQNFKIFVNNRLLIEHFSSGSLNKDWVNYSIKLAEKWKKILPVGDLPYEQKEAIEWRNKKIFFLRMRILGYPLSSRIKFILTWNFNNKLPIIKILQLMYQLIGQKLNIIAKKPLY